MSSILNRSTKKKDEILLKKQRVREPGIKDLS
jgi:hypothetical protein